MDPKWAVSRDAIELHLHFLESPFDLGRAFKELATLQHIIGWLCALSAGLFGVAEEIGKVFGAMLRAFDTWMETVLGHNRAEDLPVWAMEINLETR